MAKTKSTRQIKRKTRRIKGGMWPFTKNEQQQQQQPQQMPSSNVFSDSRLSTEPNQDMNYEEAGIVHATEAVGINMGRAFITDIANAFGSKGMDLSSIHVHAYGSLMKPKQMAKPMSPPPISPRDIELSFDEEKPQVSPIPVPNQQVSPMPFINRAPNPNR